MRRQAEWEAHAVFMDKLAQDGFIVAGGPLGGEDDAPRYARGHRYRRRRSRGANGRGSVDADGNAADGQRRAVDRVAWKTRSRVA